MNWGFRASWMLERVTLVLSPMSLNLRPLKELLRIGTKTPEGQTGSWSGQSQRVRVDRSDVFQAS